MSTFTPIFVDTFHRANESPLNPANWTADSAIPTDTLSVVSNACELTNAAHGSGTELYTGAAIPNDQYVAATIGQFVFGGNSSLLLLGRATSTFQTSYVAQIFLATLSLISYAAGTPTTLGSVALAAVNPGDILRMEMRGSSISVLYNGVVKVSVTNSARTSGRTGLSVGDDSVPSDTTVTRFETGSITSPTSGGGIGSEIFEAGSLSAVGDNTRIVSPRTVIIGTNLGTKITR